MCVGLYELIFYCLYFVGVYGSGGFFYVRRVLVLLGFYFLNGW